VPRIKLEVRQSQAIYQAAVGALVQIGGHSLAPCDIRFWEQDGDAVDLPRLSRLFGGLSFRKAPALEKHGAVEVGGRIPAVRFPRWMYCPKCRRMYADPTSDGRLEDAMICPGEKCQKAGIVLAPMPWVMVCANGHMEDLPWQMLVHRAAKEQRQITCRAFDQLRFLSADAKGHRARICCDKCHANMDLGALRSREFLESVKCPGNQPWLRNEEPCDAKAGPDGALAGAGLGDFFVHYPVVISALDIPPESRLNPRDDLGRKLRQHGDWKRLQEMYQEHGLANPVVRNLIASLAMHFRCPPEAVRDHLAPIRDTADCAPATMFPIAKSHVLRAEEYRAFLKRIPDYREYERFITVSQTDAWCDFLKRQKPGKSRGAAGRRVHELVGAPRLREVRALQGFTRVRPLGAGQVRLVPADLVGQSSWLPVAEFFGEGIFFTLNRRALLDWNDRPAVQQRTADVRRRYEASFMKERLETPENLLPAFVALHTLAHLLIRAMEFECGYPVAALRERLYFSAGDAGMAGVLIYLAAGEPGGSLGGIAQLAEPDRFMRLLLRGVNAAEWCALDPVCGEHEGRGTDGLNRAACHACCLLPETSCECGNLLLDRSLVVAGPGPDACGLFDEAERT